MFLLDSSVVLYGSSILLINICVYVLLTIAVFLFLFLIDSKNLSFLNNFKLLQGVYGLFVCVVFFIASMAGIPPLLGFVGKFLLFIYLLSVESYFLFFIFLLVNFFALYFYIQNFRFMVSKNTNQNYLNFKFSFLINEWYICFGLLFLVLNIFGFLFVEDLFITFSFFFSSL